MDRIKAISLDAFGTILELVPPAPALVRELHDGWGIEVSEVEAKGALAAEITYYRAHQLEGRDDGSLADLRERCAAVLLENLPAGARGRLTAPEILPAMMRALRFRPYPDVVDALVRFRDRGLALIVVSNWDVSLPAVLEDCGLAEQIDHVVSSAAVGAAKPSPEPFERGLELLGLEPATVVHIGDEPELDVVGALAAGIKPILIHRAPGSMPPATHRDSATLGPETPIITSLADTLSVIDADW